MKDKAVVLWFTNLCEGCQSSIPDVEQLKSKYEKQGVEFVAVSVLGKDRKTVESVMKDYKVSFRFLYDPDGKATTSYAGRFVEATCPLKNIYVIGKFGQRSNANTCISNHNIRHADARNKTLRRRLHRSRVTHIQWITKNLSGEMIENIL